MVVVVTLIDLIMNIRTGRGGIKQIQVMFVYNGHYNVYNGNFNVYNGHNKYYWTTHTEYD